MIYMICMIYMIKIVTCVRGMGRSLLRRSQNNKPKNGRCKKKKKRGKSHGPGSIRYTVQHNGRVKIRRLRYCSIILYHTLAYSIILYHTLPCSIIFYLILYHTLSFSTILYHTLSCFTIPPCFTSDSNNTLCYKA